MIKDSNDPTREEIQLVHDKYIDELKRIFYKHRDEYAPGKEIELF